MPQCDFVLLYARVEGLLSNLEEQNHYSFLNEHMKVSQINLVPNRGGCKEKEKNRTLKYL